MRQVAGSSRTPYPIPTRAREQHDSVRGHRSAHRRLPLKRVVAARPPARCHQLVLAALLRRRRSAPHPADERLAETSCPAAVSAHFAVDLSLGLESPSAELRRGWARREHAATEHALCRTCRRRPRRSRRTRYSACGGSRFGLATAIAACRGGGAASASASRSASVTPLGLPARTHRRYSAAAIAQAAASDAIG